MSAPHIILDNLPSLCQKLSDLVEVWRSYNKNNFAFFLRHGVDNLPVHYQLLKHHFEQAKLENWANNNGLKLIIDKTCVVHFAVNTAFMHILN